MIDHKLLLELVDAGLSANVDVVRMRAKRLASKLKNESPSLSRELMALVGNSGFRASSATQPSPVDSDSRLKLIKEIYPVELDRAPLWSADLDRMLHQVVAERSRSSDLLKEGLIPVKSLIFEGPPGVGKTLTAMWLAKALDLPLLILDLATVISSYLGKTGNNFRMVVEHAASFPCVLLLDEFDAIAKRRGDDKDQGELKRLVTVILQTIDDWPATSLLVAATNHGELLDRAVWRRFDVSLSFDYPSKAIAEKYIVQLGVNPWLAINLAYCFNGMSLSDVGREINRLRKAAILDGKPQEELAKEWWGSQLPDRFTRDIEIIKLSGNGVSQREIFRETGVSRPTISKVLKAYKGEA
ncbi:MAG: AAA family ATPase [Candidatus Sedimenticola sp. (ex Thyasira tokunagai)]